MPNAYANKVQVTRGGQTETLIDLTADTAIASDVAQGKYFHLATGERVVGTATGGGGSAYQDEDGYIILGEEESDTPQGNISITANGTYDVAAYAGASVDIPIGLSKDDWKKRIQSPAQLHNFDWPDGITSIGDYAFAMVSLSQLESLPSTLTSIGERAFSNSSLRLTSLPDGITSIGNYAFYGVSGLALTRLPASLTHIGASAFQVCGGISITEIPSSVTYIGSGAFGYCKSIPSISCDGAITTLGNSAFTGSSGSQMILTSASFPNMALTSNIGTVFGHTTAANACQQLEFCDIGSTVGIAANAFANCYKLQTLVLRKTASVCTLANVSAFLNTPMRGYNGLTGTVYVPSALISTYQTATNWSTLYNDGTVTFAAIEGSDYEL